MRILSVHTLLAFFFILMGFKFAFDGSALWLSILVLALGSVLLLTEIFVVLPGEANERSTSVGASRFVSLAGLFVVLVVMGYAVFAGRPAAPTTIADATATTAGTLH